MKLSARNKFIGKVTDVTRGAVNGIVKVELSNEIGRASCRERV